LILIRKFEFNARIMKDNFSVQSKAYAEFRPHYPDEMITSIVSEVKNRTAALDVATGNGQVAVKLADHFQTVYATDISARQIENAYQKPNIIYKVESAENTDFTNDQFDLITVAQAVHWFDFEDFYREVDRILKPDGVFAVLGYGLLTTNPESDEILRNYYHNIVGRFWDAERHYVEEKYETIPFPFDETHVREFSSTMVWRFDQLIGYLETWSATQHYIKANGENPIDLIRNQLEKVWEASTKQVHFPFLLRLGKLKNRKKQL